MGGVADQRAGLARSRGHRNRRWRPARAPCARSWRSWPRTRPRRAPPPPALRTCGVMAFGGGDMGTCVATGGLWQKGDSPPPVGLASCHSKECAQRHTWKQRGPGRALGPWAEDPAADASRPCIPVHSAHLRAAAHGSICAAILGVRDVFLPLSRLGRRGGISGSAATHLATSASPTWQSRQPDHLRQTRQRASRSNRVRAVRTVY